MTGLRRASAALVAVTVVSCSSGAPAITSTGTAPGSDCTGSCASASSLLKVADVQQIIAQAVAEAQARRVNATIGVVDRVGNVLAVYRMGAPASRSVLIATSVDASGHAVIHGGLEGLQLPQAAGPLSGLNLDPLAVIAKAITGAYLSSEGNAFSTRTASQIVQQHFDPGRTDAPSGPLFGVQFSQLACSDLVRSSDGSAPTVGPQRSPLGLSADAGGFPLYLEGSVVGGVGVLADGRYGIADFAADSVDIDEAIAMAATYGYGAPVDRRADQITVNGLTLQYTNIEYSGLAVDPGAAPPYSSLSVATGTLVPVTGYADGLIHAGTAFGQPSSGVRPEGGSDFPGLDAFVLVDPSNAPRYPLQPGTDGASALTQAEVQQILASALTVANQARGQIRLPLGSNARVSITVVDSLGVALGLVRSRDAPLFGADVALQKARSAALFSSNAAASFLGALPPAQYLATSAAGLVSNGRVPLGDYLSSAQTFLGMSTAFSDGVIAYSDRAIGNLSRPLFPDGIDATPNGPFSKPAGQWSVFSTGLQLDLSINAVLQHVVYAVGGGVPDVAPGCAGVGLSVPPLSPTPTVTPSVAAPRIANGLQIFPGSVPIYRGAMLVGAIGVSGDGVDQDDMVAFLGLHNASQALNGAIGQAPKDRRADTLTPRGTRLLYVQCPQAPFLDSDQENVCDGL